MRKFILSSLALMVGAVASVNAQVPVTPLVEHFTQASCGPCASQNPTMYTTLDNFVAGGNEYVKVTYQVSWPGVDPMNAAYPAGPNDRRNYYSVTGVPDARLNGSDQGGTNGPNSIITAANLATVAGQTTDLAITISHTPTTGSDYTVNVKVKNVGTTNRPAGLKLHTAVTEKQINYATAPGSNGETEFFYVVRNMHDISTGTASTGGYTMPAVNAGDSVEFSTTITAPNYVIDASQIGFATWVQDDANKSVIQSAYSAPYVPPTALDVSTANASYGSATDYCANANWTPSFEVTNQTANTVTSVEAQYTVNGGTAVPVAVTGLTLAQGQSTTVSFPAATLNGGANAIEYSVVTLNGGTADYVGTNNNGLSGNVLVLGTFAANTTPNEGFESYTSGTAAPSDAIPVNPANKRAFIGDAASIGLTGSLGGNAASSKSFIFDFWPQSFQSGSASFQFNRIDMSDATKTYTIAFDYAYAQYGGTEQDKVDINISTDCGTTWTNVWSKAGAQLATAPAFSNNSQRFMPTAAQWDNASIDLTTNLSGLTAAQRAQVIVEVKGTSNWGNPAYIDNINVTASAPTNINNIDNAIAAVKLMPNPVRDNMTLEFTTTDATDATITIVNALGQNVRTVENGSYVGTTNMNINTNDLTAGVYFLNIVSAEGVKSTRFVVEK